MAKPKDNARHEASARKLRQARRRGEQPHSKELGQALGFLALGTVLLFWGEDWLQELGALAREAFSGQVRDSGGRALGLLGRVVGACGLAMAFGATLPALDKVGFHFRLRWDFARLNPLSGLGRLFSRERLADLAWMLLRLVVIGLVAWLSLGTVIPLLFRVQPEDLGPWALAVGASVKGPLFWIGLTGLLLGLGDWRLQRRRFLRKQRMSDDERKREHKEQEGDPGLKNERRRRHRELIKGSLADLRQAKVLVINPSHVAAALRYRPEEDAAPVLLVAGSGAMAQRMRSEAVRLGLPLMEHVPLARALLHCPVGECIPGELFAAAAEVLRALEEKL